VKIIDDEEYEKNKAFSIELGEPVLLEIGQKHGKLCKYVCAHIFLLVIKGYSTFLPFLNVFSRFSDI